MDAGIIAQFALATLMPALVSVCLTALRKGRAADLGYWPWQVLCGIVFGVVAVMGTEFGIATQDATMNVRDAAPIVAGLFFGGPAGIIAGFIGGVERWFAALWGRGMFTRVACSVATCAAGVYAAMLRKYIFEERKPSWPLACATGIVIEVLHLMLVILTNPGDPARAYFVVRACTFPMIGCNGIAVALAAVVLARMAGEWPRERAEVPSIAQVVQTHLLVVIVIGFVISSLFTYVFQGSMSRSRTSTMLLNALTDVEEDISKVSDDNLIVITRRVAFAIPSTDMATQELIDELIEEYDVSEINVVDANGIIVATSDERFMGFDMASGAQSAEFLVLLDGDTNQLVQSYRPIAFDENTWRKYAGVRIADGFVQVGYDAARFLDDLSGNVEDSVRNRHVGQDGSMVVLSQDGEVVGTRSDIVLDESDVDTLLLEASEKSPGAIFACTIQGEAHYVSYQYVEGFLLFAMQPAVEAEQSRDASVLLMAFMEAIIFAMLFIAVYLLIRNEVVRNIWKVNDTLDQITQGDLEAEVIVRNNAEFISLSDDINEMVDSLRGAISAEASRIDRELGYARAIQESALPSTFPPFPEVGAFDIYASMNPAREVGGDFYDFFLVGDHTLGFLVADVSGKGIPASLFMMAAKAELSNYMTSGMSLSEAVQTANWQLCQGNEASMFVTVWAATLDYETGVLTYVNAGHNPPLLRHNGSWEWLKTRGGLFLGSYERAKYRSSTITLSQGDELFLFTDGVNEAFNANDEQYGDERLHAFLTSHASLHPRPMIEAVRSDLARWAEGAEQSDDITMLSLEYGVAPQATAGITVPATLDQLDVLLDFVHEALRGRSCPLSTQNQIDIVIEELFVNVCNYAYRDLDEPGTATLEYIYNANPSALTVCLSDYGVAFNPLAHDDPDVPTSIAEAQIGGLGILMVKRMTDDLSYVRVDEQNMIAFVKGW